MTNILDIYTPYSYAPLNAREERDHRLFVSFLLIATVILIAFSLLSLIMHFTLPLMINLGGSFLLVVIAMVYKFTAKFRIAFVLYLLVLMLVVAGQLLISSNNLSGNTIWFAIFIFLASLVLSWKHTVALTFFGTGLLILVYALPVFFPQIPKIMFTPKEALFINSLIFVSATCSAVIIAKLTLYEEQAIQEWMRARKDYFEKLSHDNAVLMNMIGHDLATPLMLVEKSINKLETTDKNALIAQKHLQKIKMLIENVRQFNAVKSGKLKLSLAKVDLEDVCRSSIKDVEELASNKNITILLNRDANENFFVLAEFSSLRLSVINNLLSNAIKFSYPNQKIDMELINAKHNVILRIKDYGMGMSSSLVAKIFDFSIPTTRIGTANEIGTGFGLPLAKFFLDLYGATIKITSSTERESAGTTIQIVFKKENNG